MARIRAQTPNKRVQSADLWTRQRSEPDTHRRSRSLDINAFLRRIANERITDAANTQQRHSKHTHTHRERCQIMWCFYRTGPSDVPELESRAPPLPLHRSAAAAPSSPASRNRPGLELHRHGVANVFFSFVFLFLASGTARGARAVHARPPLTRAPHTSRTRLTRTSEESHHHTHTQTTLYLKPFFA